MMAVMKLKKRVSHIAVSPMEANREVNDWADDNVPVILTTSYPLAQSFRRHRSRNVCPPGTWATNRKGRKKDFRTLGDQKQSSVLEGRQSDHCTRNCSSSKRQTDSDSYSSKFSSRISETEDNSRNGIGIVALTFCRQFPINKSNSRQLA